MGPAGGFLELRVAGAGPSEEEVRPDGAVEEEVVLEDQSELRPVGGENHLPEIHTVHNDTPPLRLQEGGGEACDGGFPGARAPHQGYDGSGLRLERHSLQDRLVFLVAEVDVLEHQMSLDGRHDHRAPGVVFLRGP